MTNYLSLEDLLTLAADLGVGPVRDIRLLDAAAQLTNFCEFALRPALLPGNNFGDEVDDGFDLVLDGLARRPGDASDT